MAAVRFDPKYPISIESYTPVTHSHQKDSFYKIQSFKTFTNYVRSQTRFNPTILSARTTWTNPKHQQEHNHDQNAQSSRAGTL